MSHEERNLVEILRRVENVERKAEGAGDSKLTVSYGGAASSTYISSDHRLLSNLNSEEYMHLTGEEYRSLVRNVTDHGSLTGLLDNDHPQYIRHDLASLEGDMLMAGYTSGSSKLTFVRKGINSIRAELFKEITPDADSIRSTVFYKSDGSTSVLIVDTLNKRIGLGVQPQKTLDVAGNARFIGGDIDFLNAKTPVISSNIGLTIQAEDDILLESKNGAVVLADGTDLRSETFATDTYGWSLQSSGDANFRNIRVNKINARIVSTGSEQYIGGRQTMCKSASPLTNDFVVPAPGASALMTVEPFSDYPLVHVFDNGDIVRLTYVSLYDGKYNTADCWGVVELSEFNGASSQQYTFYRSAKPNSGSARAGSVIPAGELVLNFGVSGNGYIVLTVV